MAHLFFSALTKTVQSAPMKWILLHVRKIFLKNRFKTYLLKRANSGMTVLCLKYCLLTTQPRSNNTLQSKRNKSISLILIFERMLPFFQTKKHT